MKGNCWSLNRIYGDPQVIALTNRINFLKRRHKNIGRSIEVHSLIPASTSQNHSKTQTIHKTAFVKENHSRLLLMQQLKSQRYHEAKQTSERNRLKIQNNKENETTLKRIRRREVQMSQDSGRRALQSFEQGKIKEIIEGKTNRECLNSQLQVKRIELQKQLMEEETRSLHVYEEKLSIKSQLMRRVQQFINEQ